MKVIIPAAGKGMRLRPLTEDRPKPLVEVGGRSLFDRLFDVLPDEVDEAIIVTGYCGDMIREHVGDEYAGRPITYVEQTEARGTGHALGLCRDHIPPGERFLYLYADNVYAKKDLERLLLNDAGVLVRHIPGIMQGVVDVDEYNRITNIVEWPEGEHSELVVTGAYLLDDRIFKHRPRLRENGEYYVNDMIQGFIAETDLVAERARFWMPVGTHEEYERAREFFTEGSSR